MAGYSSSGAWNSFQKNEKNKPGKFTYEQKKPTFSYDDSDIKKHYDALLNRKDFSFDINNNALYQQLKDTYAKQGQLVMMDTVGQASAMTGGYGNSYAVSAGQQAYQQSLDKLNEASPQIYQLALEQYQMEGQQLLDKYGIAAGERDTAYGMYRDDLTDYYAERDFAYGQHRDAVGDYQADRDYLYGVYADARDYEYQEGRDKVADRQWQKEFDYQKSRDKVADSQWQQEYNLQVKQFAEEVRQFEKEYNLSEKEFNEMCKQWASEHNLDVQKFKEDVRQYNTSLEYSKQQDAIQNSQWAQEFAEEQRQYNESMNYSKQQDAIQNSQWAQEFAEQQRQFEESLSEDKRQFNESKGKSEDGKGLNQSEAMDWLDSFGLLNEENIGSALTDWNGFVSGMKNGTGATDSAAASTSSGSVVDNLTPNQQSAIEALADDFDKKGYTKSDIKGYFDKALSDGMISSEDHAWWLRVFNVR